MAKKKKNSNYVTEKNTAAHLEAEAEAKKAKGKKIARIAITATAVVLAIALAVVLIGLAFGLFDYYPEATEHLVIEIEDLGTLHVELYGKDAPKTAAHFKKLAEDGYFDDLTLHTLVDGLLYGGDIKADGGSTGIAGEFSANGVENKISHKRGIISMARGEDKNSAYGQFFIVTKDSPELDGNYAAFAMITDGMEIIDELIKDVETDEDGLIPYADRGVIVSISSHDSHGH